MAHDIVNIFDDYYDAELDEDELIDDEEDLDDIEDGYDDPYEEETRGIDDW
jgi:Zn-dependent alcohol dehydrogenase